MRSRIPAGRGRFVVFKQGEGLTAGETAPPFAGHAKCGEHNAENPLDIPQSPINLLIDSNFN
jgi:hypothetical protein